jgi:hypothetical protein
MSLLSVRLELDILETVLFDESNISKQSKGVSLIMSIKLFLQVRGTIQMRTGYVCKQ